MTHKSLSTEELKLNFGKRRVFGRIKTGPVLLGFVTICIVCLLSLLYLSQANGTALKGFEIRELEKRIEDLEENNKVLELETAELQSIQRIEKGVCASIYR